MGLQIHIIIFMSALMMGVAMFPLDPAGAIVNLGLVRHDIAINSMWGDKLHKSCAPPPTYLLTCKRRECGLYITCL